jgi:hypothetical protein
MRLDGIAFFLAAMLLYLWGLPLALGLGLGWGRHKVFVIGSTVVTGALVSLLIAAFGDGRATMHQRPLGMPGMFVVLLLAAVPVMLVAPLLQRARYAKGAPGRLPLALVVGALVVVPAGAILHRLLQAGLEERALAQARALSPGRVLEHVQASRQWAANTFLSPYLWNENAELKWIIIGLGRLGFIESPDPISDSDTEALALLVNVSEGTENAVFTWTLESKLFWDRLMRAAPADRPAVAAGLNSTQASHFAEYIAVPHADWLCTPLADPETRKALHHVSRLLEDHRLNQLSAAIREQCGREDLAHLPTG